ncbi:MAG: CRISPR-associated protein Cas4 [Verrucomicrobiales bacterium]|nr:CRISPR-associated protein Cas4 [Verrucomicrobiales bacterium]
MNLLPLSALQHLLFCERQCALIHLEQVWAENQFTAEGNVMHEKAHDGPDETQHGVRIVRGLPVKSETLGLSGECDVVEFHRDGTILPIEYKRGKPKSHRADEVQLCAQALCLEEVLAVASVCNRWPPPLQPPIENRCHFIPEGRLFYGQTRRRKDVVFDAELRALTVAAAERLHELIASRRTPPAVYEKRKCEACSLKDLCLPQAMRFQKGTASWFARQLADLTAPPPPQPV